MLHVAAEKLDTFMMSGLSLFVTYSPIFPGSCKDFHPCSKIMLCDSVGLFLFFIVLGTKVCTILHF